VFIINHAQARSLTSICNFKYRRGI